MEAWGNSVTFSNGELDEKCSCVFVFLPFGWFPTLLSLTACFLLLEPASWLERLYQTLLGNWIKMAQNGRQVMFVCKMLFWWSLNGPHDNTETCLALAARTTNSSNNMWRGAQWWKIWRLHYKLFLDWNEQLTNHTKQCNKRNVPSVTTTTQTNLGNFTRFH